MGARGPKPKNVQLKYLAGKTGAKVGASLGNYPTAQHITSLAPSELTPAYFRLL